MKPTIAILVLLLSLACTRPAKPGPQKHYSLTGKVVSVNLQERTAAIDAGAIKGYMEAMTMEYPIQSKEELASLHSGDHITASVDVGDDGSYALSHIKILPAAAK